MPKDRVIEFFIIDVFISTNKIKRYFHAASFEEFIQNELQFDGIMCELEITGEALKYILNHKPFNQFVDKEWRKIIDFRNVISHDYFGLDYYDVYLILCNNFPKFCDDFSIFAMRVKNDILIKVLDHAKKDAQTYGHAETLKYLKELEKILST